MTWDDGLEGVAREIAATHASRLRVMAGPGTGKSFALQRRVARLLEDGQDPTRILVVTFTRTAAASLVDDLKEVDAEGWEQVRVSTLHSFCFRLLLREEAFQFLHRVPRPLSTFESKKVMQFEGKPLLADLIKADSELGPMRNCTQRIRAFEAAWARLQSDVPGWLDNRLDQSMQNHLLHWLTFHECMLVGELVPEALRYLRDNPMSDQLLAFDHIIVDEYQDLNRAEQEVVDLLGQWCSVSVVGDADQSIYSFRYAHPDGIYDFGDRHSETEDKELSDCRRCPTDVVKMANHLIGKNYDSRIDRPLHEWPDNPRGDISFVQWRDPEDEIEGLADYVRHLIRDREFPAKDILVLSPRRRLAYKIRDSLRIGGMSVHSFYREEALEDADAQMGLALLALLSNPEDRVALRWWLGKNSGNCLSGQYSRLWSYCESEKLSPREVLEAVVSGETSLAGIHLLVGAYKELKGLLEEKGGLDIGELVDDLFPPGHTGCAPLREVAERVRASCDGVAELLGELRNSVVQPEAPEGEFVRIMSLQKAKGLTSRIVIITSCIEGLIPNIDRDLSVTDLESSIEEQRRLFYVAVTRCTDILVVSSIARMTKAEAMRLGAVSGKNGRTVTSRYIEELGPSAPRMQPGGAWRRRGFLPRY